MTNDHVLPYFFLIAALLLGLWLYEKRQWRLGGVLVVPLLALYAVTDLLLLVVFTAAAAAALIAGFVARQRTFLYGRRLLYVYLIAGIVASGVLLMFVPVGYDGVVLTVLPGIFAYNVHRVEEPAPAVRRTAVTTALFVLVGILLVGAMRFGPYIVKLPTPSLAADIGEVAAIGLLFTAEVTLEATE